MLPVKVELKASDQATAMLLLVVFSAQRSLQSPVREWILGQAEFLEVREAAKKVLAGGEVLVHTRDVLVNVSARAR